MKHMSYMVLTFALVLTSLPAVAQEDPASDWAFGVRYSMLYSPSAELTYSPVDNLHVGLEYTAIFLPQINLFSEDSIDLWAHRVVASGRYGFNLADFSFYAKLSAGVLVGTDQFQGDEGTRFTFSTLVGAQYAVTSHLGLFLEAGAMFDPFESGEGYNTVVLPEISAGLRFRF